MESEGRFAASLGGTPVLAWGGILEIKVWLKWFSRTLKWLNEQEEVTKLFLKGP